MSLGDYKLGKKLGQGSFGVVYAATPRRNVGVSQCVIKQIDTRRLSKAQRDEAKNEVKRASATPQLQPAAEVGLKFPALRYPPLLSPLLLHLASLWSLRA